MGVVWDIWADVTKGPAPLTVAFSNPDIGPYYQWDFADGGTSEEKEPVHTFQSPGTYQISMQSYDIIEGNRVDNNRCSLEIVVTEVNAVVMVLGIIAPGETAIVHQTLPSGTRIIAKKLR